MQVGARLAALSLSSALLCAAAAACNAITGANERTLDPDLANVGDRDGDIDDEDTGTNNALDAAARDAKSDATIDVDAGPIVINVDVAGMWKSPNGATFITVDGGKRITDDHPDASHPIITPETQPAIPSDDYTVHAVVRAAGSGSPGPAYEFGIMTRVQADGSGVVLASSYGTAAKPFVGNLVRSTNWNPNPGAVDTNTYNYLVTGRYRFMLSVSNNEVRGKMWHESVSEPATAILYGQPAFLTGRGVGFYTYNLNDAVLESMTITVP